MTTAVAIDWRGDVGADEVLRAAGMTYRELDYWVRRGVLFARNPLPGSGAPRRFPADEIPVACALVRLRAAGVPLDLAAELSRHPVPDEGSRAAVRIGRGVVLCLYPDLWSVDDHHPLDDPDPDVVIRLPRQEREP